MDSFSHFLRFLKKYLSKGEQLKKIIGLISQLKEGLDENKVVIQTLN